ncbi:MAG: alpha-hydroxy-acid oxidizing protein [Candidatus Nanopelagicales bacterium]|jgi:4-hydroxymandelate oxidase|nr:alpha-hydroxy-acid oxidizing protein [Candidatus Nanopelagicales bacterium]MCU0297849.1 alpha-hydroxy-acid oxidizing protein [Candidatus Nanopelagicales bacterium]
MTTPSLDELVSLRLFEPEARKLLPDVVWAYVAGGAADEITLAHNDQAWSQIQLSARVLRDVSEIDTRLELLGTRLPHPVMLAPTARHRAYHPDGELATIAGARQAQALYVQSSLGTTPLDQVAQAATDQPWWFQLYIQRDRGFTAELVAAAVEAGARALVLTVDTPTLGARDRDQRDSLGLKAGQGYPILEGVELHVEDLPAHRRIYNPLLAPDITWDDFAWLVETAGVPVVPKGIQRADDARTAAAAGAAAIAVSNHGARNLDTVPATARLLPHIVEAVPDLPVIVDGGIRRGTDVAKALSMGASAIMIGRPYIWGLSTHGAAGVQRVVEILHTELRMAMALLGVRNLAELTRDLLWDYAGSGS